MNRTIDELTGIYSFKSFISATEEMLKFNKDKRYVLLVFDIEHFKVINDLYGMESGDALLKEVADKMRLDIGKYGTYGRIGSDKFVCCYPYELFSRNDVENKMLSRHTSIDSAYKLILQAGVYIINDNEMPVIKMCDRAIMALNSIKGTYTEKVAVYSEGRRETIVTEQQLISDLDEAIDNRQLYVMIQPVYRIKDNTLIGGEVLVRWKHPKFGELTPAKFVPLFERNHLITKLDNYVWEEACRIVHRMQDLGQPLIPLSVNVSRANIYYKNIGETFSNLTHQYDISPKYIRIEITESAYMENPTMLIDVIRDLKLRGFQVLIDDFGTGFSSLNMLKDINFDILKIDKKLIDEIETSERAGNVVSGITHMARKLGTEIIAEGVENHEQASFLRNIGCNYIQGYIYSRPIHEDEFVESRKTVVDVLSKDIEYVDMEDLFGISNAETREMFGDIVGPMMLIQITDQKNVKVLNVNEEYHNMFGTTDKMILNGQAIRKSRYPEHAFPKIINACNEAKEYNKVAYTEIFSVDIEGRGRWTGIRIKYAGSRDNSNLFILIINDITNAYKERKSSEECSTIC